MYYVDYHHHSNHSFDSKASMEQVCINAIHKGVHEICFTEHFSVNPTAPTYGHMNWESYLAELQHCREMFHSKLLIKTGIELCEPHLMKKEYKKALSHLPLDFILGSVHNIQESTLRKYMHAHTDKDIYKDYFLELYELVSHADIDVIAHFDLMKRYAFHSIGLYAFANYEDLIKEIISTAIHRGIGLEINTSGWRTSLGESLPSKEILSLYREMGGEILTIGSDSHHVETVGEGYTEAIELAKQCGFSSIFTFKNRKPTGIKIDW